jgi:alanine-synthesizing transaminase
VISSRLNWHLTQNPLSALLEQRTRAGAPVLDLTESNPTHAGLIYPQERILAALSDPRGLIYQPSPRGMESAREAVANYYRERGVQVPLDRIVLAASTSEAYAYLFKLLADPGCEILTPRPSYPLFEFLAALESVQVRQYPLRYDGAWHIDFPALERSITTRSRAIVVVNPNNPTGSFVKRDELERLEALAAAHDLAILSDEVFSDYGFTEDSNRIRTLIGERQALTFSMSGLSKIAGLPQLKLGWMVVSGPQAEATMPRLELIADTYLSVATPVQAALPELLAATESVRDQIRLRTRANLACLRTCLAGSPAHVLHVEGGWYAVLQVPSTRSEEEWALELLGRHDVLVQPGFFYDFESEAYLVVSLLTPPDPFAEGLQRIREILSL